MNNKRKKTELLVATTNKGKMHEIQALLAGSGLEVLNLGNFPKMDEVEEKGTSFRENAILKAEEYGKHCGLLTLADDSGLEVDILNGEPGIYSARYGGPGKTDADRNELVLRKVKRYEDHQLTARFRCVVAIWEPCSNKTQTFEGTEEGLILKELRGEQGFGYDPLFYFPPYGKTLGQVSRSEKEKISHRGQAVRKAVKYIRTQL